MEPGEDAAPPRIAAGAMVVVRYEEWPCDQTATFFTALDTVEVLDPRHTTPLSPDRSPHYLDSRLWL